jgi:hypothetical protein
MKEQSYPGRTLMGPHKFFRKFVYEYDSGLVTCDASLATLVAKKPSVGSGPDSRKFSLEQGVLRELTREPGKQQARA